jgi:hypothetical protein
VPFTLRLSLFASPLTPNRGLGQGDLKLRVRWPGMRALEVIAPLRPLRDFSPPGVHELVSEGTGAAILRVLLRGDASASIHSTAWEAGPELLAYLGGEDASSVPTVFSLSSASEETVIEGFPVGPFLYRVRYPRTGYIWPPSDSPALSSFCGIEGGEIVVSLDDSGSTELLVEDSAGRAYSGPLAVALAVDPISIGADGRLDLRTRGGIAFASPPYRLPPIQAGEYGVVVWHPPSASGRQAFANFLVESGLETPVRLVVQSLDDAE